MIKRTKNNKITYVFFYKLIKLVKYEVFTKYRL